MEREACLQGILHISQKPHLSVSSNSRSPSWNSSQRGAPPLEPSFIPPSKSPVYEPSPLNTRFPSAGMGPPWREMPVSGDFLNVSSRVPSEGTPHEAASSY